MITSVLIAAWTCAACGGSQLALELDQRAADAGTGAGTGPNNGAGGSDGLITGITGAAANGTGANGTGANGGGPPLDACAAHVSTAQPIPLDMYIMLDTSASMLDTTTGTITKWDAVKTALTSFLNDSASAGLGVGLQYFPLSKPNAPTSCASDADCGDSGPCFLKICYGYQGASVLPCDTEADCIDPNTGRDTDGPCLALAQCSGDKDYVCPNPGEACTSNTPMATDLGTCTAVTPSFCEHTASCDTTMYSTPAAAIATLPGAATGLLASINAKMPDGDTPTNRDPAPSPKRAPGPRLTRTTASSCSWRQMACPPSAYRQRP